MDYLNPHLVVSWLTLSFEAVDMRMGYLEGGAVGFEWIVVSGKNLEQCCPNS